MVKTKDELLNTLKGIIGDDASDEALAVLEDTADTLSDMNSQLETSGNWKQRYEENDAEWRKRYRDRFFEPSEDIPPMRDEPVDPPKSLTYEDLFKEA